jgi:hypothetical protein
MQDGNAQPCEVCGQLTKSRFGACRRTRPCRLLSSARRAEAQRTGPDRFPCELCGKPTRSKYRICWRDGACQREYNRQERAEHADRANRKAKAWRQANPERVKTNQAAWNAANQEKLHQYMLDYRRQWRADHPDAGRDSYRKWVTSEHGQEVKRAYMNREDRPCRYRYAEDCGTFAVPGSKYCREHTCADVMRRWRRKRARLSARLAESQQYTCSWCAQPLAANLAGTHVDHIIPVTCGGPDVDWNLQLLHDRCNLSKSVKITLQAVALAAEHGMQIHSR